MKKVMTYHCVGLRFLAGACHRALWRAIGKDSEKLTHLTGGGGQKVVAEWDRCALGRSRRVTVSRAQDKGGREYKCTVERKAGRACCSRN